MYSEVYSSFEEICQDIHTRLEVQADRQAGTQIGRQTNGQIGNTKTSLPARSLHNL